MKLYKNSFLIVLALLLALSLAACGQNTKEAVNGDNEEKTPEPMATSTPAPTDNNAPANETEEPVTEDSTDGSETTGDEDTASESEEEMETSTDRVFTLEELSKFDGQNGNPAYVAVDGIVYDLTDSKAWRNGKHNGFTAGKDLTEEIKNVSPHGVKNLEGIPVVGKLADD